jgi:streptogramin lyase
MRWRGVLGFVLAAAIGGMFAAASSRDVAAQSPSDRGVALSGDVSSAAEGKMEGVVVSARRQGANFTVSVVSDAGGKYSFPRTHLAPGKYDVSIRAAGFDLAGPATVDVSAGKTASANLTLQPTKDLASQLSSLEWALSMPGTEDQKHKLVYQLLSCAYCHTYERIVKSKHSAEQWPAVISRMQTYFNDGTALGRGGRGRMVQVEHPENAGKGPNWGTNTPVSKVELGQFLATVNMSSGKFNYELKPLPRPKGKATRVIMTQYDLPRRDTVPHDIEVAADGTPWYPDQSRMFIGKLDPKTGAVTEYALPELPKGRVGGLCDPHEDNEGNIWVPVTTAEGTSHFGRPAKFDPRTQKLTFLEGAPDNLQFTAKGPDGTIWMNNVANIVGINPKAMKIEKQFMVSSKTPGAPPGPHSLYQTGISSKGNIYAFDWLGSYIVGINVATGETKFHATPTRNASPRRGKMDAQDRLWFAEYTGDRLGMFDTRTETITEWPVPHKYTTPYAASEPDRNGYVYATSNMSERVMRLDPKTGEVIEYQVPTDFDSKEVVLDPSVKDRTVLWMANTRNARILKVEPLD